MTTSTDDDLTGSALERAEAAAMPTIRPELPDDMDAVADLHRTAFQRPAEAELVDAIRRSPHFIPDLSLVAELNGRVVGHLLLSRVELVPATGDPIPFLALAPVAVHPLHQGRGIGTLLTRAGLALAAMRGSEAGVVVLGSPDFYRRFGFVAAEAEGIEGPWKAPRGVFQVLALSGAGGELPEGAIAYPAPFSLV